MLWYLCLKLGAKFPKNQARRFWEILLQLDIEPPSHFHNIRDSTSVLLKQRRGVSPQSYNYIRQLRELIAGARQLWRRCKHVDTRAVTLPRLKVVVESLSNASPVTCLIWHSQRQLCCKQTNKQTNTACTALTRLDRPCLLHVTRLCTVLGLWRPLWNISRCWFCNGSKCRVYDTMKSVCWSTRLIG